MNEHDGVDDLVAMARGEVQPLAEARRERVLAGVLAAARPIALPADLPRSPTRWRPAVVVGVAAAALAAAVAAYWAPWSPRAPSDATARPPMSARDLTRTPEPTRDEPDPALVELRSGGTVPHLPTAPSLVGGAQPPDMQPSVMPPHLFEAHRRTGDPNVFPDDATKAAIAAAGVTRVLVPVKVCVDRDGVVSTAKVLKASGFPAYDDLVVRHIAGWTYEPFTIDGAPVAVCSVMQLVYSQR